MTQFTATPSQARDDIISFMQAGLVPMVTGSPGVGKSDLIRQIAQEYSLTVIDIRLSQCAPEDLMGLPMRVGEGEDMKAAFAPFNMFPTIKDEIPAGQNGWILFLDEFNSAAKSVQAAAYKLVLDRVVGQSKLHDACLVVCAGNLSTDRAIVNQLSTAMQSRLCHIEMVPDFQDFMDFAVKKRFDPRVLGFLEFQPSKLHQFSPDHNDRTFACPRTWEFTSRLVKDKDLSQIELRQLAGVLSDGVAVEFHTFLQEFSNLPKYQTILDNPGTTQIPSSQGTKYALVTMLIDRFNQDDFPILMDFVKRLDPEFQVIYFRGVKRRDPTFRRAKPYREATAHLVKFLGGTDDELQSAA